MDYRTKEMAEFYDDLSGRESRDFSILTERILRSHGVKSVLDMACGTGAQVSYLSDHGFQVIGCDISKNMLQVARINYPRLKFKFADMSKHRFAPHDAVITCFNAIGHLDRTTFKRTLANIRENLQPQGIYIFDILNRRVLEKHCPPYEIIEAVGERGSYKFVYYLRFKLLKNGKINLYHRTHIQHALERPSVFRGCTRYQIYHLDELKLLLNDAGFTLIKIFGQGGTKFSPEQSYSMTLVAQKN